MLFKFFSVILTIFAFVMGIIIVFNFLYQVLNNYNMIFNISKLAELALLGDFFSGHINGFILLILIVSLYFQRTSIEQTGNSIQHQVDANETLSKDMKLSIEANILQTKEFYITNTRNEINDESNHVLELEKELELEKLYIDKFKKSHLLNSSKIIELFERLHYLDDIINDIKDEKLKTSLKHKLALLKQNKYTENKKYLLKKTFVFNELVNLYEAYFKFINEHENIMNLFMNINDLNLKYIFLLEYSEKQGTISNQKYRFNIFEEIDCNQIIKIDSNKSYTQIELDYSKLWDLLFLKYNNQISESTISQFYEIMKDDYK